MQNEFKIMTLKISFLLFDIQESGEICVVQGGKSIFFNEHHCSGTDRTHKADSANGVLS